MLNDILSRLDELYPEMIELRRGFHAEPELSYEESIRQRKAEYLRNIGVNVRTEVGGRGVVGTLVGGKPGKTVALRADFDALPIQEETGLPFASKHPGKMHACGHDGHTATLLVLAKVLAERKADLAGTIVFIHQFAEELAPGGAIAMINDGCLDGVDRIFGTHLWTPIPKGEIGYSYDRLMAAADKFEINITGFGGHGAMPHQTVDAVIVGSAVSLALQQVVSRNVDPLEPAVVTIASFHAGGAFNVVSDVANLTGTVRTFSQPVQEQVIKRMEDVTKGVCDAYGATYEFHYAKGYPAVINHPEATECLKQSSEPFFNSANVYEIPPVMGGEDFSYYLQKVPGAFFFTGAGNEQEGITYPHHHPKFTIDEESMLIAAKHLGSVALYALAELNATTQAVN
ncbi:LOW QUALITY PROTEIN: catalyzes the cleavage of p-aminobenzoyl-glutamate to p-aminobenzoate and glutamate, subunit A [Bacillus sp. JCM 19047]|nr:LOW QUALITY PROTEIN: catalyzes the cleavage of p-aminobenzoyl-glutamate to p-aminobenzoate and glutamate, subunit A [Bacillus sp. JCM 19047]